MVLQVYFLMILLKLYLIQNHYNLNIWKEKVVIDKIYVNHIILMIIQKNYQKKLHYYNISEVILKVNNQDKNHHLKNMMVNKLFMLKNG